MRGQKWLARLRTKLGKRPFRGPEPADPAKGIAVEQSIAESDPPETMSEESQGRASRDEGTDDE